MKLVRWRAATVVCVIAVLAAHATSAPSQAQEQPVSLGESARRAREQKKQVPKVRRRVTDDSLLATSSAGPNDATAGPSDPTEAQNQPTSLGEVARRIREQRVLAQEVLCRWTDDDALTLSACRLGLHEEKKLAPAGRVLLGVLPLTTSPAAPIGPGMAAEPPPVTKLSQKENILQIARTLMEQQKFGQAIRLLENVEKNFPGDTDSKVQLGRAYLYDGKDENAVRQFTEVLRVDPSHRLAKLQLARALGYQNKYQTSDQLYRELIQRNPDDESASLGLIRNLQEQGRIPEARRELELSLARHPDSPRLREFRGLLQEAQAAQEAEDRSQEASTEKQNRLQVGETYVGDSGGNRAWRSSQLAVFQFGNRVDMRLQSEQHLLLKTNGMRADVAKFSGQFRLRLASFLTLSGGGGTVRFADRRRRPLFNGDLELHPARPLWISGGFSRVPLYPTVQATQFDLLAEGWHARLDWNPGLWRVNAAWSSLAYSDGNRDQRVSLELLRWTGTSRLAFAIGYRMDSLHFPKTLDHGYFDPKRYQSQLGIVGVNFGLGKRFRAEYLARAGAQEISNRPFRSAWDLSLRNRFLISRNWELGGDYFYLQVAQSTGAFKGQASQLWIAYLF